MLEREAKFIIKRERLTALLRHYVNAEYDIKEISQAYLSDLVRIRRTVSNENIIYHLGTKVDLGDNSALDFMNIISQEQFNKLWLQSHSRHFKRRIILESTSVTDISIDFFVDSDFKKPYLGVIEIEHGGGLTLADTKRYLGKLYDDVAFYTLAIEPRFSSRIISQPDQANYIYEETNEL